MNARFALLIVAALAATPVVAGAPVTKRPLCQVARPGVHEIKRVETCRKPAIPPVIDPTPLFLASTLAPRPLLSHFS